MLVNPAEMDAASKVWLFQASAPISQSDKTIIQEELVNFVTEWAAHNIQLHASCDILNNQFIRIMVDEQFTTASGCSMDTLHQFIHYLEKKYNLILMDRMQVAFTQSSDDDIQTVHLHELSKLAQIAEISEDTYVFDNLVPTKADFDHRWKVKIKDSWHKRFLK